MSNIDITEFERRTSHGRWMKADYESGLVTVIIPTYNRAGFVVEAMESVFRQDYRPIELIVVDDGSTDDTRTIIRSWIEAKASDNEFGVNYIYQESKGASAARNLGLIHSNGEFIQFLDSDCQIFPLKLTIQVEILSRRIALSHCYCKTEFIETRDETISLLGLPPSDDLSYNAVIPAFTSIAPLWRRNCLDEVGPWDEELTCRQDWVYKAKILLRFGAGVFIPEVLCRAMLHEGDRISKHGTKEFAFGTRVAIKKVGSLLNGYDSNTKDAKNHLAREMLAVFKALLRLQKYQQATEVLSEASGFASEKMLIRIRTIHSLCSILRPKLFRSLISAMGRL